MNPPAAVERLVANELDAAYRRRVRTVLEWLAPARNHVILDAGCGRGFYPAFVRALSDARVVGCDLELRHLGVARRALCCARDVHLVHADLEALPFAPASFDGAILSEVLEHVSDDVAVLRGLASVVRPAGRIAITVPNARYPFWWDPLNWLLERSAGRPVRRGPLAGIWAGHRRLYTADGLRSVVEAAGLEISEQRSCTRRCLPFSHNLLYGLGKPLYESGLLPAPVRRAGDRHRTGGGRGGPLNPVRWALAAVDLFDRGNLPSEPADRSSVNLCLLARVP